MRRSMAREATTRRPSARGHSLGQSSGAEVEATQQCWLEAERGDRGPARCAAAKASQGHGGSLMRRWRLNLQLFGMAARHASVTAGPWGDGGAVRLWGQQLRGWCNSASCSRGRRSRWTRDSSGGSAIRQASGSGAEPDRSTRQGQLGASHGG